MKSLLVYSLIVTTTAILLPVSSDAFLVGAPMSAQQQQQQHSKSTTTSRYSRLHLAAAADEQQLLQEILTARLPTSVEDQVRQAAASVQRAGRAGVHRQTVRLLLPLIGATELDDWPGGARQQMEAAEPLVQDILVMGISSASASGAGAAVEQSNKDNIQRVLLDQAEGVTALLMQAAQARDDACAVLLPTAERSVTTALQSLDYDQVGPTRNLLLVNPQWRRRSDFGGFFGTDEAAANYAESFLPTFSLTSLICEGESIRVLRTYPGPWRVFLRQQDDPAADVEWTQVGTKDVVETKPDDWQQIPANKRDGGSLFNYGQPTYQEIMDMLQNSPDYTPKSPAERAAAAFNFIKDTL